MRSHPDPDLLALHSLGEAVLDGASLDHLGSCGSCGSTVAELAHTVRTVRGPRDVDLTPGVPSERAVAVPAHVWQGIAAELDLDPAVRPASVGPSGVPPLRRVGVDATDRADPADERPATGSDRRALTPALPGAAGATDLGPRRSDGRPARRGGLRRAAPLLAVAAAGLAVGVAGTAVVASLSSEDDGQEPTVLAAADLEAFGAGEGTAVTGSARLASVPEDEGDSTSPTGDGRVLQVWLDDLPDTGRDGFLEAWLIDPATGSMVSLGPVDARGDGAVTVDLFVPPGLDVGTYALVDVSAEPLDGDPTHSGDSLLRGTLGA